MPTFGIWHILFMVAGYTSAIVCIYATYRIGLERGWQWGLIHLLLFGLFFVLFFLMESWAASRTPYFSYPPPPVGFPDWIKFYPFLTVPPKKLCSIYVPPNLGIPISVLLLEATLVFAAMHTSRLLASSSELQYRLLRPFMVALALVTLDFFLDPLASTSTSCDVAGPLRPGLGFWGWSVLPEIGPDAFGVPLFNYVLWYSAPVVLVALVGWLNWFYDVFFEPLTIGPGLKIDLHVLLEGAFLTLIIFAFTLIILVSPNFATLPISTLRAIMIAILLATVFIVLYYRRFYTYDNGFRWWFVYPQAAFLLFCVVAFLGSGLVTAIPYLGIVALVVTLLFLLWMLSPYLKKIWP